MDFFTADLHLGHAKIMKYARRLALMTEADRAAYEEIAASNTPARMRRWSPSAASVSRMDEALIAAINHVVGPEDTLWILGDFAKPPRPRGAAIRAYREAIRCRDVRLLWGNHDPRHHCAGLFSACYEAVRIYVTATGTLTEDQTWESKSARERRDDLIWKGGATILYLSHYCHAVWQHADRGVYHLYGHTHGNLESWREAHMPHALAMDVGVDCWNYAPVPFSVVHEVLRAKKDRGGVHDIDHHPDQRWRDDG